jgi:hypothetical protein
MLDQNKSEKGKVISTMVNFKRCSCWRLLQALLLLLIANIFMYLNHFLENNPALREATDESKQAVVQLWQPKSSAYGCRDRVLEDEWFKSASEEDR